MKDALKLGTNDAKLFYHAAMIADAANDKTAAHGYLKQSFALNPHFDPWQSETAKKYFASN